ncbi:MAG: PqqD family protein [Elusimicrobiota bacterium]
MSLYQRLARRAWRSGEYNARLEPGEGRDGGASEAEELRSFLRSKMEWIVEREACGASGSGEPPREEDNMKLAKHVKFREEKFGGVLFETRSEKVFTLSRTGAAVMREILAGGDDQAVIGRLKDRYQDPDGTIEKQAAEFIASLKEKGLVAE